jgi:hypothetical protein
VNHRFGRSILIVLAPFLLAEGPAPKVGPWLLEQPIGRHQTVQMDLVRAHVDVVRRPGPLRIEIRSRRGVLNGRVSFRVERTAGRISIVDIYPPSTGAEVPRECEQLVGWRGPYWRSDVPLDVKVEVPAGVRIIMRTFENLRPG